VSDVVKRAIGTNCDRRHRASVLDPVEAAVAANRACGYLPRCVAYISYKVGRSCSPDYCSPGWHWRPDVVLKEEAVGVAGGTLGFWLKMESNYPSQLSRNVAEKSQYGPGPEVYMELGAKYSPTNLFVNLLNCPWESAAGREEGHCCCRLA
tara:strand:+ start:34987 stop:35439 length:453 start_codon:yes stop_codon:yes gene_type:complete